MTSFKLESDNATMFISLYWDNHSLSKPPEIKKCFQVTKILKFILKDSGVATGVPGGARAPLPKGCAPSMAQSIEATTSLTLICSSSLYVNHTVYKCTLEVTIGTWW